jgi:hypothetical protein
MNSNQLSSNMQTNLDRNEFEMFVLQNKSCNLRIAHAVGVVPVLETLDELGVKN